MSTIIDRALVRAGAEALAVLEDEPLNDLHHVHAQTVLEAAAKTQGIAPPVRRLALPDAISPELEDILGTICYQVAHLAAAFRVAGRTIARKAEAEQAFCIHWFLKLYADHGEKWRDVAMAELKALKEAKVMP